MQMHHEHPFRLKEISQPYTPFVGRDEELTKVIVLLSNPACRLLTLTGPGGIGKTRLAIQAATEISQGSTTSVSYVPLHALNSDDLIAQGFTNREITDQLVISPGIAKWYTSQIYGKLNVSPGRSI